MRRSLLSLAALALGLAALAAQEKPKEPEKKPAQPEKKAPPPRPTPTVADFAYGPHARHRFDFWQAKSDTPTPLVLLIHGGGWSGGDKTTYGAGSIQPLLDKGISVAAINYRFIAQAMADKVEPPVKGPLHDAARALQTLRSKAKEWNLDKARVGATGGSAGACTSLWLAFHDDLADPKSSDPVARESTRLTCAAVNGAQTSLDPKQLREWMPNANYAGHAFGFAEKGRSRPEEFKLALESREKILPWIKEYSPIELVTKDDPPVLLTFGKPDVPVEAGQSPKDPTHFAIYGVKLAEVMAKAGVEAVVSYPGAESAKYKNINDFLIQKLTAK